MKTIRHERLSMWLVSVALLAGALGFVLSGRVAAQNEQPAPAAPVAPTAPEAPQPLTPPVEPDPAPVASPEAVLDALLEAPAPAADVAAPPAVPVPAPEEAVPAAPSNGDVVSVPVEATEAGGSDLQVSVDEETQRISIQVDNVPVSDVIRMFTQMPEMNIVLGVNVQSNITVNMQNVEWRPALGAILESVGLALTERTPGIYTVIAKGDVTAEPLIADTVFLRYTTVSNMLPVVRQMLVSTNGAVTALPSANAMVLLETGAHIASIKQNIEKMDQPRPQVFIEAKFVELNDQAIKDLGINWRALEGYQVGVGQMAWGTTETRNRTQLRNNTSSQWDKRQNTDTLNDLYDMNNQQFEDRTTTFEESPPGSGNYVATTKIEPTRNVVDLIDRGANQEQNTQDSFEFNREDIRSAVLSAADFNVVLSALKQNNGVTVVSNPKIIVSNGETAEIHVGQRRPNIVRRTNSTQGGTAEVTYEFGDPAWIDIGVKVGVTPTVNTESNITVRIVPELDRQVGTIEPTPGLTFPILVTRRIMTEFALDSGKTAAIGGLIQNSDTERVSKIPILGDIPLLGKYLFSHTHTEKSQDEVVIFVTVDFVKSGEIREAQGLPSDSELIHRHLANEAVRAAQRNNSALAPVSLRR